ncbi:MAG: DUF6356 family protein [Pseudomonadota bacterium]
MKALGRLFTQHPESVDETYFEHLCFAGSAGIRMVAAGLAALVHAVLPFLFERTASRLMAPIAHKLVARNAELQTPHLPRAKPVSDAG